MRGDAELASIMRRLLIEAAEGGYAAVDTFGQLTIEVSRVPLTEEERQAVEEVWYL